MAVKIELDEDGVSITGDSQKDIKAMNEPENLETISKIAKTFFKSRNDEQLEYEKKSAEIEIEKRRLIEENGAKIFNESCEEYRKTELKMSKKRIFNALLKTLIMTSGVVGCIFVSKMIDSDKLICGDIVVTDISDDAKEPTKKSSGNKKK